MIMFVGGLLPNTTAGSGATGGLSTRVLAALAASYQWRVSQAAKRRTLVEVRDAAGHSNIATTSIYLHIVTDDDGEVGGMFAFVR